MVCLHSIWGWMLFSECTQSYLKWLIVLITLCSYSKFSVMWTNTKKSPFDFWIFGQNTLSWTWFYCFVSTFVLHLRDLQKWLLPFDIYCKKKKKKNLNLKGQTVTSQRWLSFWYWRALVNIKTSPKLSATRLKCHVTDMTGKQTSDLIHIRL